VCRALGVWRAGSDAWNQRRPAARLRHDAVRTDAIRPIHLRSRPTDGAPRMQADLAARGSAVRRTRLARLMRTAQLVGGGRRRRRVRTTVADPTASPAPNVIGRDVDPAAPNRLWVGASTDVPTTAGWRSVATWLDAYSRRVVGWAMADQLRTDRALDALVLALRRRPIGSGPLVHHTDRGGQSTAGHDQAVRAGAQSTWSMRRTGTGSDTAIAERCFATFTAELIDRVRWSTRRAARQAIGAWLELFDHRQRRHSALGSLSPVAYAAPHHQPAAA
jgi:putative transposase